MSILKKPPQGCAVLLLVVMLLTNPVCLGPLYAASTTSNELSAGERDRSLVLASKNMAPASEATPPLAASDLTDAQRFQQFLNRMIPYYFTDGKQHGLAWLKTTDVSFSFTENYKPLVAISTVQPFSKVNEQGRLFFWQGRYAQQSDNQTANIGLGWRNLSSDKQHLVGLNVFYDYGFHYDLSRVGAGLEYFNKLAEYRANFYLPLSGDRLTHVSYQPDGILYSYLRAVRGLDYEVGTSFAHARWLRLYASGYFYDNQYNEDEKGVKIRGALQLTPRFALEMGYDKSNLNTGGFYGKVAYQLADGFGPSLFGGGKATVEKTIDVSPKLLQKVERNNTIKTETFTKLVVYQGSMSVTVKNSSGAALPGAVVQAYQNGRATGASAVTNAAGVATISGLSVGTYTAAATYFSYSGTSSTVTVQKDQVAATAISLPVVGGTATVHVFNSSSQAVSGVSVMARLASGQASAFALTLTTGADGTVQFTNLPPETYKFTVAYNGQTIESTAQAVQSGGSTVTNVVLTSIGSKNAGSAAITVTDNNGVLLNGVTVSTTVQGGIKKATTNQNGIALFSDLPAGDYDFTAAKSNYVDNTANVSIHHGVTASTTVKLAPAVPTYDIEATAGSDGSIKPTGTTAVSEGASQAYEIAANTGYKIADITVDGLPVVVTGTASQTYTFSNVTGPHTIAATFAVQTLTIAATVTGGLGGSITPAGGSAITTSGTSSVSYGGSKSFTITANSGYEIASITVDGTAVPVTDTSSQTYNFSKVTDPHTITAVFAVQTFPITASAGANGSITSGGTTNVNYNGSQMYTITANSGYKIASITVDGTPVTVTETSSQTYNFSKVTGPHTIAATFAVIPTYDIEATAGSGGSISPSGITTVNEKGSQGYTITASKGYSIDTIKVDDVPVTVTGTTSQTYTFKNVIEAHKIAVTFKLAKYTVNITISAATANGLNFSSGQYVVEAWLGGVVKAQGPINSAGQAVISNLVMGTYDFWINDAANSYPGGGISYNAEIPDTLSINW